MNISNFVSEALVKAYLYNGNFPFNIMDTDGSVKGIVYIRANINDVANVTVTIEYKGDICDWKDEGKTVKKFGTFAEAWEFIREFDEALNSIPVIRFTERFFDIDFSKIYTPFEELLV